MNFIFPAQITADSSCGDWISYRNEKCFKVIDTLTTETEAGSLCQKQLNGTFDVIRSEEEQGLIESYLKKMNLEDNV